MNTNTSLSARLPDRHSNLTLRELRIRAIGQSAVITAIAALVLAAAALAGCDAVTPVGADTLPAIASESDSREVAGPVENEVRTGFDWRKTDPVIYRDEDWPDESNLPVAY